MSDTTKTALSAEEAWRAFWEKRMLPDEAFIAPGYVGADDIAVFAEEYAKAVTPAPLSPDVEAVRDAETALSMQPCWCADGFVCTRCKGLNAIRAVRAPRLKCSCFPCANCGALVDTKKAQFWTRQDEDGEPCCCQECLDEHEELGCPLEGEGYRANPVRRERDALRSTAPRLTGEQMEAISTIINSDDPVCHYCEGEGNRYADGKAHYYSEHAPTIPCPECYGVGRIPELTANDMKDLLRAAFAADLAGEVG